MDTLDELLDAFRSENENGTRNRRMLVSSLVSMFVTWAVWKSYVADVDTIPMQAPDSPDWWGGSSVLSVVAFAPVVLLARWRPRLASFVVGALVVPLVMAGVAYGIKDERRWQKEAGALFASYTHRFPRGRLGEPEVIDQYQSQVDMCAFEEPDNQFCLSMALNRPKGEQVRGGWRQEFGALAPSDGGWDCFGEIKEEGNC